MSGNITAETLVVNGTVEGDCYVDQIQILSMGRVRGKIYSNNLTIEQGGQFFGETIELPNRANDETLLAEPPFDENAIEKLDDQSNSGDVKKTA
ncbi:Polymer-forming cytoskeletal [Vibrio thalassae]|uniref:Polymer-forming cytoskeletal n=2 Tax=Vibrio thalassae TaxID=1243014 RepID=A0A240ENL6_9VIBR|nr:Polymer-forming cytoskeletal [Vibrio thalassae]